jgi:hypothetical protein
LDDVREPVSGDWSSRAPAAIEVASGFSSLRLVLALPWAPLIGAFLQYLLDSSVAHANRIGNRTASHSGLVCVPDRVIASVLAFIKLRPRFADSIAYPSKRSLGVICQ